ncbi:hypothetical protein QZH41_008447 [Actinostola sp. cb2023]|nr:hypothetical protein QZH41_008447 [Actinostola sp. cb2023]
MFCSSCGEKITVQSAEYCPACGAKIEEDIYILIKGYFHRGYRYQAIVGLLDKFHGIAVMFLIVRQDMTSSSHMVFLSMAVSVAIAEESYGWTLFALTTNYPKITAGLYLDAVQNLGGCPRIVRSDCGSENVVIAGMQCYFRAECRDEFLGEKAHQYGSSPSNQRIEGWWSSNWWIILFKDMTQSGVLELGNEF